jgi:hypothetical protein
MAATPRFSAVARSIAHHHLFSGGFENENTINYSRRLGCRWQQNSVPIEYRKES